MFISYFLKKSQYFPFQCWVLNKGTTGTIIISSLLWRGPWLGIEPGTSRTQNQHSTTRLSRRRYNCYISCEIVNISSQYCSVAYICMILCAQQCSKLSYNLIALNWSAYLKYNIIALNFYFLSKLKEYAANIFYRICIIWLYIEKYKKVIFAQKLSYNLLAPIARDAMAVNAARPIFNAVISPDK